MRTPENTNGNHETPENPTRTNRRPLMTPQSQETMFLSFCEILRSDPTETLARAFEACESVGIELTPERINWLIISLEAGRNE